MAIVVGVQFQKKGKVFYFDANNLDIRQDDFVIAETDHGPDLGQVVLGCRQQTDQEEAIAPKKIIRIATDKDLQTCTANREKEKEAFIVCQKKIAEHKLDMKLVSVEYAFDNSKALFYFTANGRVDFRSLVKDLASVFKMRIELRQIGVRDEARMIGGLGPCGRQICCGAFLDEFQPVSIKMAKEQNLSLNPTKISGVCGRLMCCLKYEQDHYEETRKMMPKMGREVITPDGTGTVCDLNILKETVFVRIVNGDSSEIKEYPLDQIEKTGNSTGSAQTHSRKVTTEESEVKKDRNDVSTDSLISDISQNVQKNETKENRNNHSGRSGSTGKNRETRKNEKAEARNPSVLGKPVMRENPNKNKSSNNISSETEKKEKKKEGASSWAEALQKAMESIN